MRSIESVAGKLRLVEFEVAERDRKYRDEKQGHTNEALRILDELDEELDNFDVSTPHPFPQALWMRLWPEDHVFSEAFFKLLRKHKLARHPFLSMMLQGQKLDVVRKKVELLQEERAEVQNSSVDSLQLGSVAFELENLALAFVGGKYLDGFDKYQQDGTVERVYFNTFNKLENDYQYNKMSEEEKTKYERLLQSIVPDWTGPFDTLSTRLNHSVAEFKNQRVKDAHPAIDSTRLDDIKKLASDSAMFDRITTFLTKKGKIQ